jgi:hypothetical protein
MKKYRFERKGRRSFDPSADRRYTTTIGNIMVSEKNADHKTGGPRHLLFSSNC